MKLRLFKKIIIIILIGVLPNFLYAQNHCPDQSSLNSKNNPKKYSSVPYKRINSANDTLMPSLSADSLSQLKAVLVVGPTEEGTGESIRRFKNVASYLRKIGITVMEFYHPYANWSDIVLASKGANIFLYSGHGTDLGGNGKAGGLCLSNKMVSVEEIINSIRLHKNALVIFHTVCGGAGSSAGDNGDIGVNKAIKRVSDNFYPFMKTGAAGYYANNFLNSILPFLENLFERKNIKDIYMDVSARYYCKLEIVQKFVYKSKFEIGVASNKPSGFSTRISDDNGKKKVEKVRPFKNYDIAFVGSPDFSVLDFYK